MGIAYFAATAILIVSALLSDLAEAEICFCIAGYRLGHNGVLRAG